MYEYLKGVLTKIAEKYIVVEVHNIGYLLNVSNPHSYKGKLNQEVQVYIHQVIRDDVETLYGFLQEGEKELFISLISVSGIGPTSALAIIAANDNDGLVRAIHEQNISYLMQFPKIGKKTAQQMILDLRGKISKIIEHSEPQLKTSNQQALDEAIEALISLGYKSNDLKKVQMLFANTKDTTENYIKSALKMLVK